jgi:hypothetical protein
LDNSGDTMRRSATKRGTAVAREEPAVFDGMSCLLRRAVCLAISAALPSTMVQPAKSTKSGVTGTR